MSNFLIDEDTDLLAAEFVLGTLDSEEHANAQSKLRTDHGFIAMVRIWERRFGELHLMVEPVEPDAKILARIKAKIAELPPKEPAQEVTPQDRKPAAEASPGAAPVSTAAETPKPAEAAGAGEPPKPDAPAGGEAPKPADSPANGIAPNAAEVAATGEAEKPAETPPTPDSGVAAVAETPPGVESRLPDGAAGADGGPSPSLWSPPAKSPDKLAAPRRDRRPESATDVIRSRGRWRAFGLGMTLLVVGLAAMLAAWRFAPDRLPARLRPAELMMSLGIQSTPRSEPVVRPPPPQTPFDE